MPDFDSHHLEASMRMCRSENGYNADAKETYVPIPVALYYWANVVLHDTGNSAPIQIVERRIIHVGTSGVQRLLGKGGATEFWDCTF